MSINFVKSLKKHIFRLLSPTLFLALVILHSSSSKSRWWCWCLLAPWLWTLLLLSFTLTSKMSVIMAAEKKNVWRETMISRMNCYLECAQSRLILTHFKSAEANFFRLGKALKLFNWSIHSLDDQTRWKKTNNKSPLFDDRKSLQNLHRNELY